MAGQLVVWTSDYPHKIKKAIGPSLAANPVKHKVLSITGKLPSLSPGDVCLAMGTKTLNILQQHSLAPKNRTVGSMRGTPIMLGPQGKHATILLTYSSSIIELDWARKPDLEWDAALAIRLLKTGSLEPKLGEYELVKDYQGQIDWIELIYEATEKPVPISIDLETIGLDPFDEKAYIVSISISYEPGKSFLIHFPNFMEGQPAHVEFNKDKKTYQVYVINQSLWEQIDWLVNSEKVTVRGANFKFDQIWMEHHWGIIRFRAFKFDTLLVGSLLNENRSNSLNVHTKIYVPELGGYDDPLNKKYDKSRMDLIPLEDLVPYAGGDTDACLQASIKLKKELLKDKRLTGFYVKLLHPSVMAFQKMEQRGMLVDLDEYMRLKEEVQGAIDVTKAKVLGMIPRRLQVKYSHKLKLTTTSLLKDFLFTKSGLNLKPLMVTEKTEQPSTTMEHYEMLAAEHEIVKPFVDAMREHNSAAKTMSTYIVGFLKHLRPDGKFHPFYHLGKSEFNDKNVGALTGRLSCTDPAYQCLRGDQLVLTDSGLIPIEHIVQGVEIGASYQVLTHTGAWKDVIGVYRNGRQPVFEIRTENKTIVCTGNHPLLTERGFINAEALQLHTRVFTKREADKSLSNLGRNEEPLPKPEQQGLSSIRWKWNKNLQTVGGIREFPEGHGRATEFTAFDRQGRQQGRLRTCKLSMGYQERAGKKSVEQSISNIQRQNPNLIGLGGADWDFSGSTTQQVENPHVTGRVDDARQAEEAGFIPEEIISIKSLGIAETFDITIDGCHSFVAGGIVCQNTIPKHTIWAYPLRKVYITPPGYVILNVDYSQGELKVTACIANEPNMLQYYKDGKDLHMITGARVYGYDQHDIADMQAKAEKDESIKNLLKKIRQGGKAGNFGLIYSIGDEGFQTWARNTYGLFLTLDECATFRHTFLYDLFTGIPEWHDKAKNYAREHEMIRSPLGRIRHLPLINSKDSSVRAKSERMAINSPVQATLSDMTQLAIAMLYRQYPDLWVFGMTHDSLSCYVPEDDVDLWVNRIAPLMENLPLKKDFGWDHQLKFTVDAEMGPENMADTIELERSW